jgi:hypothetical protein
MVVISLKTEAMYFSKHNHVGLKIQVTSSEIQVGATIKVLRVIFDYKLSWRSHITHISNIVKKKKHTLRKISTDLNPLDLLGIAHGSIYSELYYATCTWLNGGLKEKTSEDSKFCRTQRCRLCLGRGDKNAAFMNCSV